MKKYFLIALISAIAMVMLPAKTQAQYNNPNIYANNMYLNYALSRRKARARANAKKKRVVRKAKKTEFNRNPIRRPRRKSNWVDIL